MGQVCSGSGDLVVRDGFNQLESIPLRSIRLLEPEELDDLLVRFGKKVPEEQETPTQEDIKGAEVEELG
jgi:hypothetical protein